MKRVAVVRCAACGAQNAELDVECLACGESLSAAGPAASAASRPAPKAAALRIGDYELLELLGRGGMGQVYRARQAGRRRHGGRPRCSAAASGEHGFA